MAASAGPPSLLLEKAISRALGRLNVIVQAAIVPLRGIVSREYSLPTSTCMPVVLVTASLGEPRRLGTGPVAPVEPVAPIAPVASLAPLAPAGPLAPVAPLVRPAAPTSVRRRRRAQESRASR